MRQCLTTVSKTAPCCVEGVVDRHDDRAQRAVASVAQRLESVRDVEVLAGVAVGAHGAAQYGAARGTVGHESAEDHGAKPGEVAEGVLALIPGAAAFAS